MPTPEEYRKTAESYYRLALEAKTEADRQALLELAKRWLETASRMRVLLFTGCRLREILHFRWEHVDFERGCLFLPDSKSGRKSRGREVHQGNTAGGGRPHLQSVPGRCPQNHLRRRICGYLRTTRPMKDDSDDIYDLNKLRL